MIEINLNSCKMRGTLPMLCLEVENTLICFMSFLKDKGMTNEDIGKLMVNIEGDATRKFMKMKEAKKWDLN